LVLLLCILLFSSRIYIFQILGAKAPNIHFNFLDLGGIPPRAGLVVSEPSYESMGMRVWHIFQFQSFATILNKIHAHAMISTEHFLGQIGKIFFSSSFFCRNFLGGEFSDNIWNFWWKFYKKITNPDSLRKHTQIQKKNQLNWSSDEGDIVDLKSIMFYIFFLTVIHGRRLSYHFL